VPVFGGWSPSPTEYGGGANGSSVTLLQRVFESIASQRGDAYSQSPASIVGVENMAIARAITFDGWGANQRVANNCNPSRASLVTGMLQRWERILGTPPLPGDSEMTRRARVVFAFGQIGDPNTIQPVVDALQVVLGPIFVGVVHQNLTNELSYTNGISKVASSGTTPPFASFDGAPVGSYRFWIQITTGGPLGTALFQWSINGGATFLGSGLTTASTVYLGTTGIAAHFSSGSSYVVGDVYAFSTAPGVPWMSTISHIGVQVTFAPAGYHNLDGTPNAQFYNLVAGIVPILDEILPIWTTFDHFVTNSHGVLGFRLDERDLDLEAFT
jgi:hypothetical protein